MAIPTATILTVGEELLKGQTLDTNTQMIAVSLTQLGFQVTQTMSVTDDESQICRAAHQMLKESSCLVISGGLGPTFDDVTRGAFAKIIDTPLVIRASELKRIKKLYPTQARKTPKAVQEQATYPKSARLLVNKVGVACGLWGEKLDKVCVAIPGVPGEARPMLSEEVLPRLKKKFPNLKKARSAIFRTVGQNESFLLKQIGKSIVQNPKVQMGVYPGLGEVTLRIQNKKFSAPQFQQFLRKIERKLKPWLYATQDISLAQAVVSRLKVRHHTLALAESCTGGLIAKLLTDVPGSSKIFKVSGVTYSNEMKEKWLGVSAATLKKEGAVSVKVARLMAEGVRKAARSTLGLSVTGIAGPTGGSANKPVGLVYIGIADSKGVKGIKCQFRGDRTQVRTRTAKKVLQLIYEHIAG